MSFWLISAATNCVTSLLLGALVYFRNRKHPRNVTYALFTLSLALWSLCYCLWQVSTTAEAAIFWCRWLMAFAVFIPATHLHYIWVFRQKRNTFYRSSTRVLYFISALSSLLCFTPLAIKDVRPRLMFEYWPTAGHLFFFILLIWFLLVFLAVKELIEHIRTTSDPSRKRQGIYLLLGNIIGWGGGVTNFPLWFDIPVPPVGNIFISLYVIFIFYAIVRYNLMDIRVVFSSAGIFLAVYSLAFGFPIFLYWQGMHFLAICSVFLFATPAPFIYNFLIKQAEEAIFIKERKYQYLLLQSTRVLSHLKTVPEITRFVVDTIYRIVQPGSVSVYLSEGTGFCLASKAGHAEFYPEEIAGASSITRYSKLFGPGFIDDLWQKDLLNDVAFIDQQRNGRNRVEVIIPIKRDYQLSGFMFLGAKTDSVPYSNKDLTVLTSVLDAMLVTLENANFRKEEDERRKKEDAMARREFLDQIVSAMSHEINNPNQAVIMGLGTIISCAQIYKESNDPEIINAIINVAEESERTATSISSLIDNIRTFSQEHKIEVLPVDIRDTLPVLEAIGKPIFKKHPNTTFVKDIAPDLPLVLADKVPVEEILLNYLSNACYAVKGNPEGNRLITLGIKRVASDRVRVEFIDNGQGIAAHILKNLFQIPTTTKGSNEGTGLGLWRIRKICDAIGAQYGAFSDGPGKGSRFWVDFRVVGADQHV